MPEKPGVRVGAVVRRVSWHRDWPAWLVSLVYVAQLAFVLLLLLGGPALAGYFLGAFWKDATFFFGIGLLFWGYVHERVRERRRLQP